MNSKKRLTRRDKLFWISIGIVAVMLAYLVSRYVRTSDYDYSNFTEYQYQEHFSIFVPDYMVPDDSLSLNASLQFSDFSNEVFLLIIEEQKAELNRRGIQPSAKEYYEFIKENIIASISNAGILLEKDTKIDGLKTLTCEISGSYADQKVFYIFSVLESDRAYYQLLAWTTDAVKNAVKRDFYAAFITFSEL